MGQEEKGRFMVHLVKNLYQKTTSISLALLLILSNFVAMVPVAPRIVTAAELYSQGFEVNIGDWTSGGDYGTITRTATGTNGIASADGNWHALVESDSSGPFTRFDGYKTTWPGTWKSEVDVYLDPSWTDGSGFDFSVAANRTSDTHLRDFIFHVAKDTSTGELLVAGSNNTDFTVRQNLETLNHYSVTSAGWYTLQHVFYDNGGKLFVDLNLLDDAGNTLFTETRSNVSDDISIVGGNRYGWFTVANVSGGLAIDNVYLNDSSLSIAACTTTSEVHSTSLADWDLSETRTTGHNSLVSNGLRVWTEGNTSTDKAAGYFATNFVLADAGVPNIEFESYTGGRPSLQLGVDKDADGDWDGYLVYEPWAYAEGYYWSSKDFGINPGMGYTSYGTLTEYLNANPDARVISIGYSLGSGVLGDAVINKITTGCAEYTFGTETNMPNFAIVNPGNESYVRGTQKIEAKITDESDIAKVLMNIAGISRSWNNGSSTTITRTGDIFATTVNTTTIADGPVHVVLRGTDGVGNTRYWNNNAASRQHVFYVDNTKPEVELLAPSTAIFNSTGTTLSIKATDNLALNKIVANIYKDSVLYKSTQVTAPSDADEYIHSVDLDTVMSGAPLPEGNYYVKYNATDKAGNLSTTKQFDFIVDNTAPTVTVKDGFVGNLDAKLFSNVGFKLYDAHQVDKYVINGFEVDFTNNVWSDANFANILGKLVQGTNTFVLFDVAGNSTTYEFIFDSVAPDAPTLVSPSNNAIVSGASLTNEWGAVTDAHYYVYESYHDAGATSLRWSENFTATSKTATNVSDTTFWWRVKAVDEVGNISDWSPLWKVTVDNNTPFVEFTNPTDETLFNSNVEVRATVTDENLRHYWVQVKKDDLVIYSQTILSSGITDAPVYTATEDGDYIVTLAARDLAGGTSTSGNRSSDVVKSFTIDKTAPNAPTFNSTSLTEIGGNAEANSMITVFVNSAEVGTSNTDEYGIWSFIFDPALLEDIEYLISATATDKAGNTSAIAEATLLVEPEEEESSEEADLNEEEDETEDLEGEGTEEDSVESTEDDENNNPTEDGQGGSPEQSSESSSDDNSDSVAVNPAENNALTSTGTNNQVTGDQAGQGNADSQAPDATDDEDTQEEQAPDEPQDAEDAESSNEGNQDIAGARDEAEKKGAFAWYWWVAILAALSGGWWIVFGRRNSKESQSS